MTLRVNWQQLGITYYKHFDTPCQGFNRFNDTECQNVYNK
jgi:hypothetical protein